MSISITTENKNSALSISDESKNLSGRTWADASDTWGSADYPWSSSGGTILQRESKSSLSLSDESKN